MSYSPYYGDWGTPAPYGEWGLGIDWALGMGVRPRQGGVSDSVALAMWGLQIHDQ